MPGQAGPHPNKETLSAYADRELSPAERVRVDQHLAECPACRAVVHDYRNASDLFQRLPARRVPMSMNRDMWRRIESADEQRRRARWLPFPLPGLPGANALGLAVAALLLVALAPQMGALFTAFSLNRTPEARLASPRATEIPLATPAVDNPLDALPTPPPAVPTVAAAPAAVEQRVEQPTVAAPTAMPTASTPAQPGGAPTSASSATGTANNAASNPARTPTGASAGGTATRPAQSTQSPVPQPSATATAALVQYRVVSGQVASVNRNQRTMAVADSASKTWQFGVSEGTLFVRKDGQKLGFEDVGLGDQVEVTGFETQPAANTLMASQVKVLTSVVQTKQAPHVLVLLDGAEALRAPQYGFTGDWIKRLNDTGYAVTALDPSRITGAGSLKDFAVVVIGYPATLSPTALQAVKDSKLPVLLGDPRLVQPLGVGVNVDPAQPTRMVAGKSVEIAGQASPVTRGYNGDTGVANDTLYRTPIVANGTVLGSVSDGGRKQTVWSVTGSTMYFGFWWSNTGQNHNAAYWTLFDRSVLLLLGKDPLGPTPAPGR